MLPEQNAVKYDSSIPYEQAAMFEPSTVALHGLLCNDYQAAVMWRSWAAEPSACLPLSGQRFFGAKQVVVFDILDSRLDLAKRLGADAVINSKEEGYQKQALELTEGKGFDYVFETAGNPVTMQMGFELAGNKAKVCFIGTPHVDMTFTPKLWENMNRKEFKLTGSWMSYSSPFPGKEWELTAHYFATGQLKFDRELIYKTFPMSRAQEAFALYKIPGEVKGKIMLVNE